MMITLRYGMKEVIFLQHRDSDTTEKYEISKFDGTLLDNIVNQWW